MLSYRAILASLSKCESLTHHSCHNESWMEGVAGSRTTYLGSVPDNLVMVRSETQERAILDLLPPARLRLGPFACPLPPTTDHSLPVPQGARSIVRFIIQVLGRSLQSSAASISVSAKTEPCDYRKPFSRDMHIFASLVGMSAIWINSIDSRTDG